MEEYLSFLFPGLVSLLLVVFTVFLKSKKSRTKISTLGKPPGPPKLPLIGNLHQLMSLLPHHRLAELAKTYGPIMHIQLCQAPMVIVSSPEIAKKIFRDYDINFSDRCRVSVADIIFYNRKDLGFAPYGDYWKHMRKIVTMNLFNAASVQSFRSIREEELSTFIKSINSKVGSPIIISEMIYSLITSIVSRTVIGSKDKNKRVLMPVFDRVLKAVGGFTVIDAFPTIEFIHVISGMKSRLVKLHNDVDEIFESIINERKAEKKECQNEASNLLDALLKLQGDPEYPFSNDSVKAIILGMFLAGIQTTGTTMMWAFSRLIKNPRVMKKAQQEIRKVHTKYGRLDETIVDELPYLKAVVKETLRLHPPGPLLPRQCREACELNGYYIDAKTEVLVNVWAIGRDPNYWVDPESFYPERFFESQIDFKGSNFEFIPFGAGRRMCPSLLYGVTLIELPLAQLLCQFDWELPNQMKPEDLDMTEDFAFAVKRKEELCLIPVSP